jgi:hypothetical protein
MQELEFLLTPAVGQPDSRSPPPVSVSIVGVDWGDVRVLPASVLVWRLSQYVSDKD